MRSSSYVTFLTPSTRYRRAKLFILVIGLGLTLLGIGGARPAQAQSPPVPVTTIKNAQGATLLELKTNGDLTLPSEQQSGIFSRLEWRPGNASLVAGASSPQATGFSSVALNAGTIATGGAATALGDNTTAQAQASLAIGRWNTVEGDQISWIPTDPLLVAGNGLAPGQRSNALVLRKNGNLTIAGTLNNSSDARFKTGVEPIGSVLAELTELRPVRFYFKENTGHPSGAQLGLIAQEVQDVFPEIVSKDEEGYLSLSYSKLTAVLLKGLQEQQTQIEEQHLQIQTLEQRIAALEAASHSVAHAGWTGLVGWTGLAAAGALLIFGLVALWSRGALRQQKAPSHSVS